MLKKKRSIPKQKKPMRILYIPDIGLVCERKNTSHVPIIPINPDLDEEIGLFTGRLEFKPIVIKGDQSQKVFSLLKNRKPAFLSLEINALRQKLENVLQVSKLDEVNTIESLIAIITEARFRPELQDLEDKAINSLATFVAVMKQGTPFKVADRQKLRKVFPKVREQVLDALAENSFDPEEELRRQKEESLSVEDKTLREYFINLSLEADFEENDETNAELFCLMDIFNGPAKDFSFKRKYAILHELFGCVADPEKEDEKVKQVVESINDADTESKKPLKVDKYQNLAKNSVKRLLELIESDKGFNLETDEETWGQEDFNRLHERIFQRNLALNLLP